jgi:hypothetical protein
MRYVGSREVSDATVSYGKFRFTAGILLPRGDHDDLEVHEPLPNRATVTWRDAEGRQHCEVLNIVESGNFHEVLIFEIDDSGKVRVRTESRPPRFAR